MFHGIIKFVFAAKFGLLWITRCLGELLDFSMCHDDFNLEPSDGVLSENTFPWLGFVQYLHVTTGMHHHSRAPRLVLVHRQFALVTASDVLKLPKNYKLGHVVFGEYDRDEEDCGISKLEAKEGKHCIRAYIELPITDINPHPEFSRFGVGNSLALIKLLRPLRSRYMLPVCLPTIGERRNLRINKIVFMVDYISIVPHDFEYERMGKKTFKLYNHKDCKRHRMKSKAGRLGLTHALCSSGCGARAGAPIISHSEEGTFELVGLTAGGAPCSNRSMRRRFNDDPPLYIDIFPYRSWIVNVITAHLLPFAYPKNFQLMADGLGMGIRKGYSRSREHRERSGWKARTFVAGNACFRTGRKYKANVFFYSERFEVNADPPAKLNLFMKISGGADCTIVCARLLLPNRYCEPVIKGVGGYNISVQLSTMWFPYSYYFSLGIWGRNATAKEYRLWGKERSPGFW